MKKKKVGVFVITVVVLFVVGQVAFADVANDKNTYLAASHEAGHCVVDEVLFPNQVHRAYLEDPSFSIKARYLLTPYKTDYFATISGKTATTIVPQTKEEHLKYAAVIYAGQEAAYMMMIERYPDMDAKEHGLLMDNSHTGAASDNARFEECLVNALKAENKISQKLIPSKKIGSTEMPNDEVATLYLQYMSASMDEAKRILEENRPALSALSDELFVTKNVSGERIREIIKNAK